MPESWWDKLVELWHPQDPWRPCEKTRAYLQTKYAISKMLRPQSIFEIGVRCGYSAFAMLCGSPDALYVGIDDNSGSHGGFPGAIEHAKKILSTYWAFFRVLDSKKLDGIPACFELAHVDGNHDYENCKSDILWCTTICKNILIDDVLFIGEVERAVDDVVDSLEDRVRDVVYFEDGFRGQCLIRMNDA